ncbi:hypothetical protein ACIQZN_03735 [Streptomyces sp. NPDC097595]|uniref:hypothetical protein n=1 Tax=Streptomyces sp. NPDC097595 TaxID=3366090 RepID=UPI00382DB74A
MTDPTEVHVAVKPAVGRRLRVLTRALAGQLRRQPPDCAGPGVAVIRHSAEVRQAVWALTLCEIPVAFLVSSILPVPARAPHALLEAALILLGFSVLAAMARHPHTVSSSRVVLSTGFLGEISLPRDRVQSASRSMRTLPGRGLRAIPGEPGALACSLGGSVSICVRLDPPVHVNLGKGGAVEATAVYVSADTPEAFPRALSNSRAC